MNKKNLTQRKSREKQRKAEGLTIKKRVIWRLKKRKRVKEEKREKG